MIEAIFRNSCPNCNKDISSGRLIRGLLCEKCLPDEELKTCDVEEVKGTYDMCILKEKYDEWEQVFKEFVGFEPWELQRFWTKKLLLGRSFALLAPTGIGKTSWGLATALYFAKKNKKSYVLLPTRLLILQSYQKLKDKMGDTDLLVFGLGETNKQKKQKREKLQEGKFKILITSSMFLYKNVDIIPKDFDFVFIDDVDSFVKTAKNIDKALYLLGFTKEEIELTLSYIKERRKNPQDEKIKQLHEKIKTIAQKNKAVMVVSSATSSPKSDRIRLFKELLSFEVGRPIFYLRNIEDVYEKVQNLDVSLIEKVKKFGSGGLVFLSSEYGKDYVEKIKDLLSKNGVTAESYENLTPEILERYKNGEIRVLIGIASYRNPLARGLDLPEVIRYAIFYGVPKIEVNLDIEGNAKHLLIVAASIRSIIARDQELENYLRVLDKWLKVLTKLAPRQNLPKEKVDYLREEIKNFILSPQIYQKIKTADDIVLQQKENKWTLSVADITGYLQASGRTSRLYVGGISKGLSYILVDDEKVFNNLVRKSRWWFSSDIVFKQADSVNIDEIFKEINLDRQKIKNKQGRRDDFLRPVLVIVESPHKARTIANFFGKPIVRSVEDQDVYEVITEDKYLVITASLGHIFDLNEELGYYGVLEKEIFVPIYEPIEGKEKVINAIKQISKEFDLVFIATDPDTEGEKISWDLKNICAPYVKEIRRMEFHEVTRKAIINALKTPRDVNEDLVKAQIVRRISDRWVGFELSQLLQKTFFKNYLSAGRVQTPVLGWVIERSEEHKKKIFLVVIRKFGLEVKFEFENRNSALSFFNQLKYIEIIKSEPVIEEKSPLPPFTTGTILREASERYKLGVVQIMEVLQELFEMGFITYHRTDSIRVSEAGINVAKEYIYEQYGQEFFKPRTWTEEGAHECIRPTRALDVEDLKSMIFSGELSNFTDNHLKIYDLIFKRFIASQMKNAVFKKYQLQLKALDKQQTLDVYEEIIQDGFNKIMPIKLVNIKEGLFNVHNNKYFYVVPKVSLFTQGSLVEEMKKRGLGRPSTYATIVSRLLERGYVVEKNGYLYPTRLGILIYRYLNSDEKKFKFVKEDFTKELEELMDRVESGTENYQEILVKLKNELARSKRY